MSSSDRALTNAFREIALMADRISLPRTIVDRSNNLFKQVHDGRNLKGRSNDAIASACLYISCRQEGVPRTFKVRRGTGGTWCGHLPTSTCALMSTGTGFGLWGQWYLWSK